MRLDDFLRDRNLTSEEFATLSGIGSKQTVHNYRRGIRFPNPANMLRIEAATAGAVTAQDFLEQYRARPRCQPEARA